MIAQESQNLQITILPLRRDNYAYLLIDKKSECCAILDPSDAAPVIDALKKEGISKLDYILITHRHDDHIGGVAELCAHYDAQVVAPAAEREFIPHVSVALKEGSEWSLGASCAKIMEVAGHTQGHIVYWFKQEHALFCGDALFSLGCGRLFEGDKNDLWHGMMKLKQLPDETRIYCGHEYTQNNGEFALSIDKDNPILQQRMSEVRTLRAQGLPTIPSYMGLEKKTNPFLRADDPALQSLLNMSGQPAEDVAFAIRRLKDSF